MPLLHAMMYVFRWSFLVAALVNFAVAFYFAALVRPADVDSAAGPLVGGSVFFALSLLARVLLERRAED